MNAAAEAQRTVVGGMAANAALAGLKLATGFAGNSSALIADGIESLGDVLSSATAWFSLRVAVRPADEDHPFGHGKAEQLGALASAVGLLAAGGFIAFHSIGQLGARQDAPAWFTLPVLLLVILVKAMLARALRRRGEILGSTVVLGDAWHHRADAITSGASALGLAVALLGGPAFALADDIAALVACLFIAANGITLLRRALHESMDGAPGTPLQQSVRRVAESVGGVRAIEKLRMKKTGLGYFVDIHVQVDPLLTVDAGHRIGGQVKAALLAADLRVEDVVVHLEPHHPATDR